MGALYATSLIVAASQAYTLARDTKFDRAMEIFNEVKLIVIMYHMMYFSDLGPDPETQFNIGYSCIVTLLLGTAVNFLQIVVTPIKRFKKWLYVNKQLKLSLKSRKAKISQKMSKEFHGRRVRDLEHQGGTELEQRIRTYDR